MWEFVAQVFSGMFSATDQFPKVNIDPLATIKAQPLLSGIVIGSVLTGAAIAGIGWLCRDKHKTSWQERTVAPTDQPLGVG